MTRARRVVDMSRGLRDDFQGPRHGVNGLVVGGKLLEAQFLIELEFLRGREKLAPTPVISFLRY